LNEPLKILVAEDDVQVQEMLEDALSEAAFSKDAVILLIAAVASFRALVTDVNLSGTMSGWEPGSDCQRARCGLSST
jgi:DNA-binding response OmpR family regulator